MKTVPPAEHPARRAVVAAMARLDALGMNRNATGNASLRTDGGFLLTPSGVATADMAPDDIVFLADDGTVHGRWAPSTEWRLHRDILRARPEIGAVVHTHATFCSTLACLRRDIPAFHYMIALAGGSSIRCAPYALFGTQDLADAAVAALDGRKACLLANHGNVILGRDLDEALALALEVESLAEQYWRVLQAGEPHILSDAQMAAVLDSFKGYGRRRSSG